MRLISWTLRSGSEHADHINIAEKLILKKSVHSYSFVFISWKQNLTWIRIQIRN